MRPRAALAVAMSALVATVGAAEGLGASASAPGGHAGAAPAPVVGAQLVCPDVVDRVVGRVDRSTRLGVAAPATPATAGTPGVPVVTVAQLRPRSLVRRVLTTPDRAHSFRGASFQGDVVVDASGPLAPGLVADEFGRRDAGAYRGLDSVACTAPGDSAWLIGASTSVGAHAVLRITNTDNVAALVDIDLFGPGGVINASNAVGLAVAPRTTRVIPLETLAPAQPMLMVHVMATTGRVAVALRQQRQAAATPLGMDWVARAQPPSRLAVVPGLTAGTGPRRLVIGNPGDLDATATIRLVRTDASFVPRGLAAVTVPAGSVVAVDIRSALANKFAGAVVTADHPLVAGAGMNTGPGVSGYAEQAYSAAVPALSGATAVVENYVLGRTALLLLTAPTAAATVRIDTVVGAGPAVPQHAIVRVGAGRTAVYDLARLSRGQLLVAVVVTPQRGSGPVYAARDEVERGTHGPLFTVLPLVTPPQFALVPAAALDVGAGLAR